MELSGEVRFGFNSSDHISPSLFTYWTNAEAPYEFQERSS
jgi:hypothetical protein